MPPPRGTKRPRLLNCGGIGCGQPKCWSCNEQSDGEECDHRGSERGGEDARASGVGVAPAARGAADAGRQTTTPVGQKKRRLPEVSSDSPVVDLTGDMDNHGDGASGSGSSITQPQQQQEQQHVSSSAATAVNEDGNGPADSDLSFKEMIDALDDKTVRSTLARLASMAPSAQTVIKQVYTQQIREQQQKNDRPFDPIDFDHHSKTAWHALHTSTAAKDWKYLDEVRRAGAAKRTLAAIAGQVADMRSQIRETTAFEIKLNALETIRKMLKSILLGSSELAVAVRDELRRDEGDGIGIGDDAVVILMSMDEEEMIRAGGTADGKGTLAQKFAWCREEAKGFGLKAVRGLDTVVELMGMSVRGGAWD